MSKEQKATNAEIRRATLDAIGETRFGMPAADVFELVRRALGDSAPSYGRLASELVGLLVGQQIEHVDRSQPALYRLREQ